MMAAFLIPETYVTVEEQLLLFAGSCLLGIPLGLFIDACRLFRRTVPHPAILVLLEDIVVCFGAVLLLLTYTHTFAHSVFRAYYAFGCFLGWLLYVCTVGNIVMACGTWLCRAVQRIFVPICKKRPAGFVKVSKKCKNGTQNTQNPLHETGQMVYNIKRYRKKEKGHGKSKTTD